MVKSNKKMVKNNVHIRRHCYNDVLQKNYEWWMNYVANENDFDSINNPHGNISKARIMRENSHWDIKDMQFLNRHLITIDGQDHSTYTENDFIYKVSEDNGWWFNKQNLIVGEKYTFFCTQKPYIEFLCSPTTLKYLKNVCDTDDLVQCMLNTVDNERINLTKIIYYNPSTNFEDASREPTNWRPFHEAAIHYSKDYNCIEELVCASMISRIGYGNEQDSKNENFLKRIVEILSKMPHS